jgi:transaldolase
LIDTATYEDVSHALRLTTLDGVTVSTGSLYGRFEGANRHRLITTISDLAKGAVTVDLLGTTKEGMLLETEEYRKIHGSLGVAVPMSPEGIRACNQLSRQGTRTTVTRISTAAHALLATRAGASAVRVSIGDMEDDGRDGVGLVAEIIDLFSSYNFRTETLVAGVRHVAHVMAAARLGVDGAVMPLGVLEAMYGGPGRRE